MRMKKRKRYTNEFKFKIALEAIKNELTIQQIASKYNLHPNQISNWKKQLLENGFKIYERSSKKEKVEEIDRDYLLKSLG